MSADYVVDADIVVGFRGEHAIKVVLTPDAADRLMGVAALVLAGDSDLTDETQQMLKELLLDLRDQVEQLPESALPEGVIR